MPQAFTTDVTVSVPPSRLLLALLFCWLMRKSVGWQSDEKKSDRKDVECGGQWHCPLLAHSRNPSHSHDDGYRPLFPCWTSSLLLVILCYFLLLTFIFFSKRRFQRVCAAKENELADFFFEESSSNLIKRRRSGRSFRSAPFLKDNEREIFRPGSFYFLLLLSVFETVGVYSENSPTHQTIYGNGEAVLRQTICLSFYSFLFWHTLKSLSA